MLVKEFLRLITHTIRYRTLFYKIKGLVWLLKVPSKRYFSNTK